VTDESPKIPQDPHNRGYVLPWLAREGTPGPLRFPNIGLSNTKKAGEKEKKTKKSATTQTESARWRRVLLDCTDTHRRGIAGKPHRDAAPPPTRASACHFVLPCATDVVHACRACHSSCLANLLPQGCLPLHCRRLPQLPLLLDSRKQKLRGARRHPGELGTEPTLSNWGDARVLVSSEHKAASLHRASKSLR